MTRNQFRTLFYQVLAAKFLIVAMLLDGPVAVVFAAVAALATYAAWHNFSEADKEFDDDK
jgi:hypothetical protein